MKYQIYIGIDPSGERPKRNSKNDGWLKGNTGLCILDASAEIVTLEALSFFELITLLPIYAKGKNCLCVVEQPDGQPVFPHRLTRDNVRTFGRKNRDLGKNQLASNLYAEFAKSIGCEVMEITPKQKGRKWTLPIFKSVSKRAYDYTPTQHEIDAYQLALYGKQLSKFSNQT